jgi:hypothetical protein
MHDHQADRFVIPTAITTIADVPLQLRGLYESALEGYVLTRTGKTLQALRAARAENNGLWPASAPVKPGKEPKFSLPEWKRLISAANADERQHLMREKAAGRIRVITG